MSKSVTVQDVASHAGVSVATVSRVLNASNTVSDRLRTTVEKAIADLGYEPRGNTQATKHLSGRIALVVSDITNPYFPATIRGVTAECAVEGFELLLYNCDRDAAIEKRTYDLIANHGVSGTIIIPFSKDIPEQVDQFLSEGFPTVFMDRSIPREESCSVTSDNEEGSYQAATYLLQLGHRRILYVAGPEHYSTTVARTAGFRRGLEEFGLEMEEALVFRQQDTGSESAYRRMLGRLGNGKPDFTAVFASNDLMAYGIWQALEEEGYKIPTDVSIVGYDDLPYSTHRQLTTIAQPSYEIGRNAVMLLGDLMSKKRRPPVTMVLRDSLIIRKSCQRLA